MSHNWRAVAADNSSTTSLEAATPIENVRRPHVLQDHVLLQLETSPPANG